MKRHLRKILVVLSIPFLLIGGVFLVSKFSGATESTEQTVEESEALRPDIINVSALVVEEHNGQMQLLACAEESCVPQDIPSSVDVSALSDGTSWFRYVDVETDQRELNGKKRVLQRVWPEEDVEPMTIVEQTPLIKPRDLIISPDSKKLAYWLDNTDTDKNLTELWLYDEEQGGTNLLLENVSKRDIKTRPRWNRSSTQLWYIADAARPNEPEQLELVVVEIQPAGATARFLELDWSLLADVAESGVMDINLTGRSLAFAEAKGRNRATLSIKREGEAEQAVTVRGEVVFVQWLEDNRLLYAVQDDTGFTFWQLQGETHRHVTRHSGTLKSVHGDVRGEYLAYITKTHIQPAELFVLHIDSGLSRKQLTMPRSSNGGRLVHVTQGLAASPQAAVAGVTSKLDDGQLIAFLENNAGAITGSEDVAISRIMIADEVNTLYADYGPPGGTLTNRVLLTVKDAIHTEWSIKGRYEAAGVSWRKVQGGGLEDPKPARMYEWEQNISQWILKEEF